MHTSFLLFGAELDSKGTVVNECPGDIQSRSPTERVERETNPSSAPADTRINAPTERVERETNPGSAPADTRISAPTEPAGENRILVPPQLARKSAPRPSPQARIES